MSSVWQESLESNTVAFSRIKLHYYKSFKLSSYPWPLNTVIAIMPAEEVVEGLETLCKIDGL